MMLKCYSGLPLLVILSCLASACKNPSPDSQSKAQKSAPSFPPANSLPPRGPRPGTRPVARPPTTPHVSVPTHFSSGRTAQNRSPDPSSRTTSNTPPNPTRDPRLEIYSIRNITAGLQINRRTVSFFKSKARSHCECSKSIR
jgi:hypothetical protein